MTAPTSDAAAVSKTVRAMSKVWARMLIAGTVNPWTSPRARAMYRSWMLAERAPSSWLASQTSQRATSTVGASSENAAVQARSRIGSLAEGGRVIDEQPVAVEMGGPPARRSTSSATDAATVGMRRTPLGDGGRFRWYCAPPVGSSSRAGAPARRPASERRLHDHQRDDDDDRQPE